jgi:exopolyphosphatase / guanosine-5'-triphosphate,3'-diphosphate pyrophosphatase
MGDEFGGPLDEAAAEEGRPREAIAAGLHAECARPSRARGIGAGALIDGIKRLATALRVTTGPVVRIAAVRVGIVDVGANTLRLLVAARENGRIIALREQRVQLGLGDEIEQKGTIGEEKLGEAAAIARAHVRRARKLGCDRIDVLVTSPGRQAENGRELVKRLAAATSVPTRVLEAEEEGELAWHGAVAAIEDPPESVAVCDVGGGSTQLVVGTLGGGPAWARSFDLGSLRLTRRALSSSPPSAEELEAARHEVKATFVDLAPPLARGAVATGGTARALRKVVGPQLYADALADGTKKLAKKSTRAIASSFDVDRARARTLLAGALILSEVQQRLGTTLEVGRGGIREGAALLALEDLAAAAV